MQMENEREVVKGEWVWLEVGRAAAGSCLSLVGTGMGTRGTLPAPLLAQRPGPPASAVSWGRGGSVIVESQTELEVTAEWRRSHGVTAEHGRQGKCGSTAR